MRLSEAEAIFHRALEFATPAERASYLEGACQGDAEVRTKVEELLRAHLQAGRFLPTEPSITAASVVLTEGPGTKIGRYKLLQQIGEGGMGVVYMAEQTEPVTRKVALKIIKVGMDTRAVVARFEAERQALALMDHPNIAKVLDAGESESGRPYFVMELVRGVPITEYCDKNRLRPGDRLELFIPVCQAIQHAHQKGIIHRDIKPSNVLVTLHDGNPVPKVIDFGIAKALNQRLTEKTLFTNFASMVGTPAYMSPEQAEMSGLDIDTRSDVYSLGVLLYELLTGTTPFPSKELLSLGYGEMQRVIAEREPPKPSTRLSTMEQGERTVVASNRNVEAVALGRAFRGDLDWIVMKALEKDRTRRYETVNGLVADLHRHLRSEPVSAAAPTFGYQLRKFYHRNRVYMRIAAGVAVLLLLATVVATWQAVSATRARRLAQSAQIQAQRSAQAEAQQRLRAEQERDRADLERERAEANERVVRQRAYASDMNLVSQAVALGNLGRAHELLDRHRPQTGQEDLRGWEWRYLWRQCRSDALFTLCQTSNRLSGLAVSPDGKLIAVGDTFAGELSVWDSESRQPVAKMRGESYFPVCTAFSPQAPLLAYSIARSEALDRSVPGNRRCAIGLYNTGSGVVRELVPAGGGRCYGLGFSGDGRYLVASLVGSNPSEATMTVWSMPDGEKVTSFSSGQHGDPPGTPFVLAPQEPLAAQAVAGGSLRVIDIFTGREKWSAHATEDDFVNSLAFSPDGKLLASGAGYVDSRIHVWDAATGRKLQVLEGHNGWVSSLVFCSGGRFLASASGDHTIRLWELKGGTNVEPAGVLRGHKSEVSRLAVMPDQHTLVSASKDGEVCLWDVAKPATIRSPTISETRFGTAFQFSKDGKSILTLNKSGDVVRWQGSNFTERQTVMRLGLEEIPSPGSWSLFSPDQRYLAAQGMTNLLGIWDLQDRKFRRWLPGTNAAMPVAFLANGRRLITIDRFTYDYQEWDLTSGQPVSAWRTGSEVAHWFYPAFFPDEKRCVLVTETGEGRMRDMVAGEITSTLR